jgi:menaquinone-dependent protoporphyrinogen oxidase
MNKFLAGTAYAQTRPPQSAVPRDGQPAKHVLLIWESKHGSTAEISYAIAGVLRTHGVRVRLSRAEEAAVDDNYDAFVIGSAVYAGHWMKHVKQFVHEHTRKLLARPVWLFSSGPQGNPPQRQEPPVDVAAMIDCTAAKEHKIFGGKLDPEQMSFPERAITRALHAPCGDFRDWDDIRAWATGIAESLTKVKVKS